MKPLEFEITGLEAVEDILRMLPQKYAKKPMVAAFRRGAREFTSVLRRNTPKDSGETRKAIKVKAQRGGIGLKVGFTAAKGNMPGYFKAYWLNYGTLSRRDSSHNFTKPRKPVSKNWRGGIRAQKFVEESWEQTKATVQSRIENEIVTQTHKFLEKHAVK